MDAVCHTPSNFPRHLLDLPELDPYHLRPPVAGTALILLPDQSTLSRRFASGAAVGIGQEKST